ncbi:glutathionylspermidine synthase family protein [Loktanella sp. SALINAS62]|uniref:glutathionylspermidine synthase family protein n=1 Tax=Loktanella sp. SALINAS62 TaxID=2706124 RepID=UPI001B8B24F7|nr:glutathionylspermidine synthase family protein [Loktanella sp. SALINAS62]MBS1302586.1 glutathionylspermidine synthase family protein [Loktanella sp. SALINAS62]
MKRIHLGARPDLAQKAEAAGFTFHAMYGEPYWDEDTAYAFTLAQVENDIEDPATELHEMSRAAAAEIIASEELMERLAIPRVHWDLIADSWASGQPELYGRFDLIYDGTGPAKMIEYNADTPTALFESASFQWTWLEDMIASGALPDGSDQFNSIFEALTAQFQAMFAPGTDIHFTAFEAMVEDYATVEMLAYAARAADMGAHFVDLPQIGVTDSGQFADADARIIGKLFKLYPWEDLLRDDFAKHLATANCQFIEPAWKAVVSNKGLLPVLWRMFEGHPNLLPSFFADEMDAGSDAVARASEALAHGTVTKPVFGREGASVTIARGEHVIEALTDQTYATHPMIVQAYAEMPEFEGFHPVIGAWVVGQTCVGMGLREDKSRITQNLSRFKPHYILD